MEDFSTSKKINWREVSKLKLALVAFVVIVSIAIILSLFEALFTTRQNNTITWSGGGSGTEMGFSDGEISPASFPGRMKNTMSLDTQPAPAYKEGMNIGGDSEDYESLSYYAQFKKVDIDGSCNVVENLKPLKYVVFESMSRNDNSCRYSFKVERKYADAIAKNIKSLHPDTFTTNTETMKKQIVEYDSQISILLRKQDELEKMLNDAVSAYDELTVLATKIEDAEILTKIINSKLSTIKQLTNERISLAQQIDRMAKRSAELNDRVEYVYFSVRIDKYDILNKTAMKDSWISTVKTFVRDVNNFVQKLTIGLLSFLLKILLVLVYLSIILFIVIVFVKYGWRIVKNFWKK